MCLCRRSLEQQQRNAEAAVQKGLTAIAELHAARERLPEELRLHPNTASIPSIASAALPSSGRVQRSEDTMQVGLDLDLPGL